MAEDLEPVKLVDRYQWDALPAGRLVPVKFPIEKVTVTVDCSYGPCKKKHECIRKIKDLQSYYILEKKMVDIPHNFMIGYDGRVYEGRGWNVKSHISEYNPEYKERSIDIGILGSDNNMDFPDIKYEKDPMTTLKKFIKYWVSKGIITKDHTVRLL